MIPRLFSKYFIVAFACIRLCAVYQKALAQPADKATYLADLKLRMMTFTTKSNNINLVFHGHSVPSGYWAQSTIHTFQSYPNLLLKHLNAEYPHAVVNVIITARGSETAERGQLRFAADALIHDPDVLFIDYALNDIGTGIDRVKVAWEKMIEEALKKGIKVVLVTPSPDQRHPLNDPNNIWAKNAEQIRQLAAKYHVGLADPYAQFQKIAQQEGSIVPYMSHVNHPNEKGHEVIATEIFRWFN
jgi:lysophospholipase L1-like esterase